MNDSMNDEESATLNREINNLREILRLKVQKHGIFSHPEVILTSKALDSKIIAMMNRSHSQNKKKGAV